MASFCSQRNLRAGLGWRKQVRKKRRKIAEKGYGVVLDYLVLGTYFKSKRIILSNLLC